MKMGLLKIKGKAKKEKVSPKMEKVMRMKKLMETVLNLSQQNQKQAHRNIKLNDGKIIKKRILIAK